MSKTIKLRGLKVEDSPATSYQVDQDSIGVTSKGKVRLGATRGMGDTVELPDVEADDLACVEYSNGFKFWTRAKDLYLENPAQTSRGILDTETDVWEIELRANTVSSARGTASIVVEALEFFGVDLKGIAAEKLCAWFEQKQLENQTPGMYQLGAFNGAHPDFIHITNTIPAPDNNKAILLFIHGTGSSTQGGFGKLWEKTGTGPDVWTALKNEYADACYAFEHRSLTVSPIDNALEIAKLLPDNAKLHLVSHSRGGLVGELLCLAQREKRPDVITTDLLNTLFDCDKDQTMGELMGLGERISDTYETQKEHLLELVKLLDEKNITVGRFVRVACPARGTTLASGRLDRWLSILQFLSGGNDFIEFLLGVVKERTDPRTLAGLEAMMPGSALVRLLNYPDLKVSSDLTVIAGDVEGDSVWGKLKLQLVDWFFDGQHDLVVNTGSMYGGLKRKENGARFFFDHGKDVNHFSYFKNKASAEKLKTALLADNYQVGFDDISKANHLEPARGFQARAIPRTSGPLAIVLHGTMGSHLSQDSEHIWLDYWALGRGKLAELGIEMPNVTCQGLLSDFYGDFVKFLGESHRVEEFSYDWRVSVKESADKLAQLVNTRLVMCEAKREPLRFVAHSLGGLVVRVMFASNPQLWKRFQALPGSRFMMFGTPNGGSYEALRWLTGWNPTLNKLSLLDITHDTAGLVNIVSRYPGLLELLPSNDGRQDYSDIKFWEDICQGGDKDWPIPKENDLKKLRDVWKWLSKSPIDSERMFYIAGYAPETVWGYANMSGRGWFSKERPPLRFTSTRQGDGTVPWAFGLLPGVKTWYVEAAHDQLLAYHSAFSGYLDILQTGSTSRLSMQAPAGSRDGASTEGMVMSDTIPDRFPTEGDMPTFVFGAAQPPRRGKQRVLPQVKVSVVHGNLAYARYPIFLGHYLGDTIVGSEAELDKRLHNALSQRMKLGLYPGELNSHEIFLRNERDAKPQGAVVIGLGRVGEISPGALEKGISKALLDYALKISDWPDDRFGKPGTVLSAKFSFILVGTGLGGVSLRDSIKAILNAVKSANNRLVEAQFNDKVIIDEIELLELYQDLVISAARELAVMLDVNELAGHFNWQEQTIKTGPGGLKRILFEPDQEWWHRLEIVYDNKNQILRFIALTDRARAEETLVAGQMRLADRFIADMISTTRTDGQSAQTLFEMLLPNRLKEMAPDQYHVVLIVDKESARFPWELLQDRWSASHKPQSVAAGLLRQLKTPEFRARPLHTVKNNALVIGNPLIAAGAAGVIFPDLPGAAREAETVAEVLYNEGYAINDAIGGRTRVVGLEAKDIMAGLHGNAYRILHLAGHGVHEFETGNFYSFPDNCLNCGQDVPENKQRVSGMVIGNNSFLTPGDVEQMRWVPELVFINCCYLGSTEVRYPEAKRYNALAANLGTQFINMGVKAVIAAGWAVDDGAAKAFAESFYRAMLSGQSFGLAVLAARQHIYEQFPDVNTWGAYQCYGDPDFHLSYDGEHSKKQHPDYRSPDEWVTELENILGTLHNSKHFDEGDDYWQQRLEAAKQRVPENHLKAWEKRADVAAALGTIYGELGKYDKAIEQFEIACVAHKAEFSVKNLEQLANYRVKYAVQFRGSGIQKEKAETAFKLAIKSLNDLVELSPTVERLSLLGSAYKRRAWFESSKPEECKADLASMCDCYQKAFDKSHKNGKLDAYPLTNWITAETVYSWFAADRGKTWQAKKVSVWTDQVISDAKQKITDHPEYWDFVVEPDCLLMKALVKQTLEADELQRIAEGYRTALQHDASQKDKAALREHIEFLVDMAMGGKKVKLAGKLAELLRELE